MPLLPTHQRMFNGTIRAAALADQLAARFNDRQHKSIAQGGGDTSLVQIGSKHGTPVSVHIADIEGIDSLANLLRMRLMDTESAYGNGS